MLVYITQKNLESEVLLHEEPILLYFSAAWCGPCRMVSPLLDQLELQKPGLRIGKIDIDRCPEIAERYGVELVPTLIYIKSGQTAGVLSGLHPKKAIEALIS